LAIVSETSTLTLEPGTLWPQLKARTQSALQSGALQSLTTDAVWIEDRGIAFFTRILANLKRKETARKAQTRNPFLPYEEDLFVANLSKTHLCLLNKYNVVKHHLLIVTRAFEAQENWLNRRDFEAMWACLAEIDGLAFYNGGESAGASQAHKHLQLIPFEPTPTGRKLPIEAALERVRFEGGIGRIPSFDFPHAIAKLDPQWLNSPHTAARATIALYRRLLYELGIPVSGPQQTQAYNLLATREWLLIVPRSQAEFQSIPVNSLGFAGALLVRNAEQLAYLKACGPLTLLKQVAI
jgi:ATP adenylyltransferase